MAESMMLHTAASITRLVARVPSKNGATLRSVAIIVLASSVYGFAIGSVHSTVFGLRNLIKFPLLILVTAGVCAVAYNVVARFFAGDLSFTDVQHLVLRSFRDVAVLLASLSPVCYFLAVSLEKPDASGLGEYPFFLGWNVFMVGTCGTIALVRQTRKLAKSHSLSRFRGVTIVLAWLLLSLVTGGQWAWYLRPFMGVATIPASETPFCLGIRPDFRGATSFYEAVFHLVDSPPLPKHYVERGGSL